MPAAEWCDLVLPRNREDDDFEGYLAALGADCAKKIIGCAGNRSIWAFHRFYRSFIEYALSVAPRSLAASDLSHTGLCPVGFVAFRGNLNARVQMIARATSFQT